MKEVYNGAFELEVDEKVDLGETSDHRQLGHRNAEDSHPVEAITGLQERLDGLRESITELQTAEAQVVELGQGVQAKLDECLRYKESAIAGIELAEQLALQEIVDMINETILSITGTATKLETGTTPTVTVTSEGTAVNFAFGLPQGEDGEPGQDGHTPVRGVDYWTQADQDAIIADVLEGAGDAESEAY